MLDVYSLQYLRERYKNNHMLKIGNIMRVRREVFQEKKKKTTSCFAEEQFNATAAKWPAQ